LGASEKDDRKFRGEILKIERRDLEDFSLKFAVKLGGVCKPLKFSGLRNGGEKG
jgi:hypothetical protein